MLHASYLKLRAMKVQTSKMLKLTEADKRMEQYLGTMRQMQLKKFKTSKHKDTQPIL